MRIWILNLIVITLSIGVTRVFVPQREADVHRSGARPRGEKSHKGKIKEGVCACVTFDGKTGKQMSRFGLLALRQGSGSHQIMSGKDEATSGQSHRSAGVSLRNLFMTSNST